VVRQGQGREMTQALYAHMNNKIKFKKNRKEEIVTHGNGERY
jgi:hypothetical protein